MNSVRQFFCVFFVLFSAAVGRSQTITVTFNEPGASQIVHDPLSIRVTITSTYQIQSVQASIEDHSVALVSAGGNAWSNTLSMGGLSWGNKILTISATDAFANSNGVQQSIVYDLPPTITVNSPANESVIRSNIFLSATASDDGPAGAQIKVMEALDYIGGGVLAIGTNSVSTNVVPDNPIMSLFFKPTDSAGQFSGAFRVVYIMQSTNLVEIARVSDGAIRDVSPDRILFLSIDNHVRASQSYDGSTHFSLMAKSRVDGTETPLYDDAGTNFDATYLTPQGVVYVLGDPTVFSELYQFQSTTQLRHQLLAKAFVLSVKGNWAAWDGNYFPAGLRLADLLSTNTYVVTNNPTGTTAFDLADNGDLVFTPQPSGNDGHQVLRYRNGVVTLLANDAVNTNRVPKTDGNNVCYIKNTSTNQVLMVITNGVETPIATGVKFGSDLQINNGWIAYSRDGGTGTMQVWRTSLGGTNTQLTFFGSSSSVAALAPNGEVAVYNGLELYISKGAWPPVDIATSPAMLFNSITPSLKPFWQVDRWYATLGGSLFQIFTGSPQIHKLAISNNVAKLDIMAASGQRVVTQVSSNLTDWVDLATNNISDGANLNVTDGTSAAPGKFYRLKVQ